MTFHARAFGFKLLALLLVAASGCSKDYITNVTEVTTEQGIVGRVTPAQPGTVVAAWQAVEVKSAHTDAAGYFAIEGLPVGLYEVRITAPGGDTRILHDVEVKSAQSTNLGDVVLSLLDWPLLGYVPSDGTEGLSPIGVALSINSEAVLDVASMASNVLIVPTVAGKWIDDYGYGPYRYTFVPDLQFAPATSYVVSIRPSLKLQSGEIWGDSVSFAFTTDSSRMVGATWLPYYGTQKALPSSFTGSLFRIRFNSRLDTSTIVGAVVVTPTVTYSTVPLGDETGFTFALEGGLVSGTDYEINMDGSLQDDFGNSILGLSTVTFSTERFRVTSREYPNGRVDLPPRLSYSGALMYLRYNIPVNLEAAKLAISIDPPESLAVYYYYSYDSMRVAVATPLNLRPSTTYTLQIDSTLAAMDGAHIGEREEITFEVQDLKLTGFGFNAGPQEFDTIVNPGLMPTLAMWFNADVDVDSLNAAASFSPLLDGFWYVGGTGGYPNYQPYLRFFPTSPADLAPEQVYTLTIDGTRGLAHGVGLGADRQLRIVTRPVEIESMSPSQGTQGVSTNTLVTVRFNTPMDRASVEAAFEMSTFGGTPVTGTLSWYFLYDDTYLQFYPAPALTPGESYQVYVRTTAMSRTGAYLKQEGYTFFQVGS